eukprot:4325467-Heterocapsa_arctica.AAC.1
MGLAKAHRANFVRYFGTLTRSMVTTFELTYGNFIPVCRMLQGISEWYALVVIVYKVLVGFIAIRIISGIFMADAEGRKQQRPIR